MLDSSFFVEGYFGISWVEDDRQCWDFSVIDTPCPLGKFLDVVDGSGDEERVSKVELIKEDGCLVTLKNQFDRVVGVGF